MASQPIAVCPFCREQPSKYPCPQRMAFECGEPEKFQVHCQCGAIGPEAPTSADAITRWNIRAAETELPKLNIRCETVTGSSPFGGVAIGTTSLNVVRVEPEDDGSFTAITDYWPDETELREALEKCRPAIEAMMNAWLDYHDAHSLTEPVTGAAGNAFDQALAARDAIDAALSNTVSTS